MNKLALTFMILGFYHVSMAQGSGSTFMANGRTINKDSLNAKIRYIMKDVGITGLSFAVIDNNKLVFYNTYGYKSLPDKKKVDAQTNFEACSLSKNFIVYVAYSLVDKGILDLDKPLYQYLEYDALKHDERYKLITARMVLSHCSGIENHKENNNNQVLEIVAQPGASFVYSGEGYVYLSKVMEKLMHKPVEAYLQELVYDPLKLQSTFTICNEKANKDFATGHDAFGKPMDKVRNDFPDIAGRIHTNAADYARMMIALFDEKHISHNTINEMLKPATRLPVPPPIYYGAGYEVYYSPQGDTIVLQGGDNDGFKGLACYSVVNKCGIVFFANSDRAEKMGNKICELATGLDIRPFYDNLYNNLYPSAANTLFRLYREKGTGEVRSKFDAFMQDPGNYHFRDNDMVELVYYLKDREYDLAKYIAMEYLKKHPASPADFVFKRWLNKQ